jgi:lipopolysaccharide biosynthesis protein
MLKIVSSIILLAMLSACKAPPAGEDFVPIIGLNQKHKSEVKFVSKSVFNQQMTPFISEMSDSVSTTLDMHEDTQDMPWNLSRVTVGLGLQAETEILGALEAEAVAEIELRFQKN